MTELNTYTEIISNPIEVAEELPGGLQWFEPEDVPFEPADPSTWPSRQGGATLEDLGYDTLQEGLDDIARAAPQLSADKLETVTSLMTSLAEDTGILASESLAMSSGIFAALSIASPIFLGVSSAALIYEIGHFFLSWNI